MRTKLLGTAAAVGLFMAAGAAQALPISIQMTEVSGVTTGPTVVAGPTDGTVTFNGTFGDFNSDTVSGTGTFGTLGPLAQPHLSGSTVNISSTCSNCELIIKISETGLTFPVHFAKYQTNYDWLAATNVTDAVFSAYISNTNTAFGTNGPAIGAPFTANAQTASLTFPVGVGGIASTFAETLEYDVFFGDCSTAACFVSLQSQVDATQGVPEPASLSLLGGALLGFGTWRRRRKAA